MMRTEPLVSVVIPAYNCVTVVSRVVNSALTNGYRNLEVVVVDDGSTDKTREELALFGEKIRYVRQENLGPAAARNKGIELARGEVIAFLDADDEWLPGKLAAQIQMLTAEAKLGMVATAYIRKDVTTGLTQKVIEASARGNRIPYHQLLVRNRMATPTVVVRRVCFEQLGGFQTEYRFGEDWDMWTRIAQHFEVGYVNRPLAIVNACTSGITLGRNPENMRNWEKLIQINQQRARGLIERISTSRRAWSWYYANRAVICAEQRNDADMRTFLMKSIAQWPFGRSTMHKYGRLLPLALSLLGGKFRQRL
jgi:glycosyltransferase involved in cell wall biosynthesis